MKKNLKDCQLRLKKELQKQGRGGSSYKKVLLEKMDLQS